VLIKQLPLVFIAPLVALQVQLPNGKETDYHAENMERVYSFLIYIKATLVDRLQLGYIAKHAF